MKLDPNKSKSYAGGIGSAGSFVAGSTAVEHLTTIITWLLSLVVSNVPDNVAPAIAWLLVGFGSYHLGRLITFYAPPNQSNPDGQVGAYVAELEKRQDEPGSNN